MNNNNHFDNPKVFAVKHKCDSAMISLIVPVYNVEPCLRKCLDSIVGQTYLDLEILVVDDGSTDESGAICDEYAEKDSRIRVFHTENRGLSCARNLGLDEAKGEWIGFVDSDDWIESDMYECMLRRAEETGADVVECGVFKKYPDQTVERKRKNGVVSGAEALQMLLRSELSNDVWSKLWHRHCFAAIRFPEKRVYEDLATTYVVFSSADRVATIAACKYHYLIREDSLSKTHNIQNLVGYWLSSKERADYLWDKMDEAGKQLLLKRCAIAAARTWAYYDDTATKEKDKYFEIICEMNAFTKEYIPLLGKRNWKLSQRVGVFFAHFSNILSFRTARILNRIVKRLKK